MDEAAGREPRQPDDRVRSILQRAGAGLGLATGTVRTVAHHPGWAGGGVDGGQVRLGARHGPAARG